MSENKKLQERPQEQPKILCCWDVDMVLSLFKFVLDDSNKLVEPPPTIRGKQVFVKDEGMRSYGHVFIPNIPLLKIVFQILEDNGITSVLASQRITYTGESEISMKDAMFKAFDSAFGTERKFLKGELAKKIGSNNEVQKSKEEKNKNHILEAYKKHFNVSSNSQIVLIDDCVGYKKPTESAGFGFIHFEPLKPENQVDYLAVVLLRVLPIEKVLEGIAKHAADSPEIRMRLLSAVFEKKFHNGKKEEMLQFMQFIKQYFPVKCVDRFLQIQIKKALLPVKGQEDKTFDRIEALLSIFADVDITGREFCALGEQRTFVSDKLISALREYKDKKSLGKLHKTLQNCYTSVEVKGKNVISDQNKYLLLGAIKHIFEAVVEQHDFSKDNPKDNSNEKQFELPSDSFLYRHRAYLIRRLISSFFSRFVTPTTARNVLTFLKVKEQWVKNAPFYSETFFGTSRRAASLCY